MNFNHWTHIRWDVFSFLALPDAINNLYHQARGCSLNRLTRLTALSPGPPRWAGTRKAKLIWILLKQETVSGSGISWNICKSAPRSRQITTPEPHRSVFYRPDALPVAQPTASKHWRLHKYNTICPVLLFIWVAIAAAQKEQQQYGGKSCSSEWMKIRHHYSKW